MSDRYVVRAHKQFLCREEVGVLFPRLAWRWTKYMDEAFLFKRAYEAREMADRKAPCAEVVGIELRANF